jgi:ferrochelatase
MPEKLHPEKPFRTVNFIPLLFHPIRHSVLKEKRTAVILVNVGTPDRPDTASVRRYLSQFLCDRHVMNMPRLFRKILVKGIIVPFRAPRSAKMYEKLWTSEGSPLRLHLENFAAGLNRELGTAYRVFTAMRYGNPSLTKVLNEIRRQDFDNLIVFPLFPQYASSTTGSITDFVRKELSRQAETPSVKFIEQFYDHPGFVEAFAENIAGYHPEKFDHIIFSFHGLPNRHLQKIHPGISPAKCICEKQMPAYGKHCYKATCYETARLLADKLGLPPHRYSVTFQSRFSKNWLRPFTDKTLVERAQRGDKKVLIAVPSFVADCLETLVEIEIENGKLFRQHGGRILTLVKSLNAGTAWIRAAADIVRETNHT